MRALAPTRTVPPIWRNINERHDLSSTRDNLRNFESAKGPKTHLLACTTFMTTTLPGSFRCLSLPSTAHASLKLCTHSNDTSFLFFTSLDHSRKYDIRKLLRHSATSLFTECPILRHLPYTHLTTIASFPSILGLYVYLSCKLSPDHYFIISHIITLPAQDHLYFSTASR